MKIRYLSAHFHKPVPRLDAGRGVTAASTTFFDVARMRGLVIELDAATGIVTLTQHNESCNIPREGVERFGPTLEQGTEQLAKESARMRDVAAANARAAAETEVLAARPRAV